MAHLSTYLFYRRLEGLIVSALLRLMASVRLRSSSSRDLARLVPSLAVVRAAAAGRAVHGFAGNALSLSTYGPLESRLVSVSCVLVLHLSLRAPIPALIPRTLVGIVTGF